MLVSKLGVTRYLCRLIIEDVTYDGIHEAHFDMPLGLLTSRTCPLSC